MLPYFRYLLQFFLTILDIQKTAKLHMSIYKLQLRK